MIASWLSYLEHAVEQAQEAGEIDPALSAREIAFELDSFAQGRNAKFQLFRDRAPSTRGAAPCATASRASAPPAPPERRSSHRLGEHACGRKAPAGSSERARRWQHSDRHGSVCGFEGYEPFPSSA